MIKHLLLTLVTVAQLQFYNKTHNIGPRLSLFKRGLFFKKYTEF